MLTKGQMERTERVNILYPEAHLEKLKGFRAQHLIASDCLPKKVAWSPEKKCRGGQADIEFYEGLFC